MRSEGYDIIIPIYNAYEELVPCMDSLLKYTSVPFRVLLIDDCSPDKRIQPYIQDLANKDQRVIVLSNHINMGFVKTVNKGMSYSQSDVILLNSDTILTENWLEKMDQCAYSSANIGTVTPFTNNGTICSVPITGQDNELPKGFTIDSFAEFIEHVSMRKYPVVPTAVGFCMLIKRVVLEEVGFFDEENYLMGYGEENDFCCRVIEHGYVNVIDDATFVYHKGSMSFKEEKKPLIERNSEVLKRKFPYYFTRVEQFLATNPIRELLDNINHRMPTYNRNKKRILYVSHNTIDEDWIMKRGGTELHILDLVNENVESYKYYTLTTNGSRILLKEFHNGNVQQYNFYIDYPIEPHTFFHDQYRQIVEDIINTFEIDLVHVHHLQRHTFDLPDLCNQLNVPIVLTVHDYYLVCPSILLLDYEGNYCFDLKTDPHCSTCLKQKMGYGTNFRGKWREIVQEQITKFDMVIFPSASVLEDFESEYHLAERGVACKLIEHGIKLNDEDRKPAKISSKNFFNVAFVGTFAQHKGSALIHQALLEDSDSHGVNWYLIGDIQDPILSNYSKPNLYKLGGYNRTKIVQMIKELDIDLVCILSTVPETFSYTLSEAWAAKAPVLVNNIGALGRRVKDSINGWLLESTNGKHLYQRIISIKNNSKEYAKVKERVSNQRIMTVLEMASVYKSDVYEPLVSCRRSKSGTSLSNHEIFLSMSNNQNPSLLHLERELREKEAHLNTIYNTLGWRFISYMKKNKLVDRYGKRVLLQALKFKNRKG